MKRSIFSLMLFLGVLFSTSISAAPKSDRGQKVYVQHDQIALQNEHILLNLSEGLCTTRNLRSDAKGYFVYSNELLSAKEVIRCPDGDGYYASSWEDYELHRILKHGKPRLRKR